MSRRIFYSDSYKTPVKYKQTDITYYFGSSKMGRTKRNTALTKTKISCPEATIKGLDTLSDDSDFEDHTEIFGKKKNLLPYPISDEEDNSVKETEDLVYNKDKTRTQFERRNKSCKKKDISISKLDEFNRIRKADSSPKSKSGSFNVNQSDSNFDNTSVRILQNVVIPTQEENNAKNEVKHGATNVLRNNSITEMMQLNRPKKSYEEEEMCPAATSTPCKIRAGHSNQSVTKDSPLNSIKSPDITVIVNNSEMDGSDATLRISNDGTIPAKEISNYGDTAKSTPKIVSGSNNVTERMQLNTSTPKKSCGVEEIIFPAVTSTPCKIKAGHNDQSIISDSPQDSSGSSNSTIIVNYSKDDVVPSKEENNTENKAKNEGKKRSNEELQDTPTKKQKYSDQTSKDLVNCNSSFSLKFEIKASLGNEPGSTNICVSVDGEKVSTSNTTSKIFNSDSLIKSLQVESTPSTSGKSIHTSGESPMKSSGGVNKKLNFDISSPKRISTYETQLSSPRQRAKQSTPRRLISSLKSADEGVSLLKLEEKEKKMNFKSLDCMKELFSNTLEDDAKKALLMATDVEVIEEYLKMDVHYQYFLLKLFLYLPKWYSITKFCSKIYLDQKMNVKEINKMYEDLKERKYLDTDVKALNMDMLLNMLSRLDLKRICKKFKQDKTKCNKKEELINILKKNCRTQSTLSFAKSTEDLLREAAYECLGYSVKLRDDIRRMFYKTYLLQTFTNSLYADPQKYLSDINFLNVTYPSYDVEKCNPFSNREQFTRFYQATLLKKEYYDAVDKNDILSEKTCCDTAFEHLQNITSDGKYRRDVPIYLQKFSAEYQYISILKSGIRKLIKYHESMKIWLEYLTANYRSHYALGFWYKQLAHIVSKYEKDYEYAATIVIQAFKLNAKENIFNLVQIYDLSTLATRLRTVKSYGLCTLFCDKLAELAEMPIDSNQFPKITITAQTDRSGKSGKRVYSFIDDGGETNFGSVENIVLNHYHEEQGYDGIHCEGRLLAILFNLLFWDVIYICYVPETFISKFQHVPLDMNTDLFYKNRKEAVEERLEEIAEKWTEEEMRKTLKKNWDNHSHEESLTKLNSLTDDFEKIYSMFRCINRRILSKIFKRLVTNYSRFHTGLPDLFLWNSETSKCKFVEVKGEGDKLSLTQILWIKYLMDIKADVEVCHVSGVGAKKIKTSKAKHDKPDSDS